MKLRILAVLVCLAVLITVVLSIVGTFTKESIEDKMCDNQKFTMEQLRILADNATLLVSSGRNRTADEIQDYILVFQTMRDELDKREHELDADYC